MKQFDDNTCTNCGGTGSEPSGVEYMGAHEMIGCDWCCGTGFDDIYLGVERLRTEIAALDSLLGATRLLSRDAALAALEDLHDSAPYQQYGVHEDERGGVWASVQALRELPVVRAVAKRQSLCSSCGRTQPSDPTSKYFLAQPHRGFDYDWDGCERGSK